MNDRTSNYNLGRNMHHTRILYKICIHDYSNILISRKLAEEKSDGIESLTDLLPSLLSEINQHSTKSEADLIHV
ncbi:hypothetical protein [Candidatus Nitrosocosmicus franklandus]|uniref:Uncharacterized protein n=1 Tax=Candidatus Nitrosocosmicus franklandianus TaxID=1798806 RepID=A0A484I4B8_9ARCH|nr:hypothetical protein [Candidatus Nitrosocosmicus franklandus]VFJ12606.1 protein of unknown function [Candidatus Nitrosocosmicus franklandus]